MIDRNGTNWVVLLMIAVFVIGVCGWILLSTLTKGCGLTG